MSDAPRVAIIDYGLGNLYSVARACEHAGMSGSVTSDRAEVLAADAVILPGVGAFGGAMKALHERGLPEVLREVAASGKPLVGVCLGMQLLMSVSYEFGEHEGLGIVPGEVVPFERPMEDGRELKVPQVGWNRIHAPRDEAGAPVPGAWDGTPLAGVPDGEYMYFVHSFYVRPADSSVVLSTTVYGDVSFCSTLRLGGVFAAQYHPERSGLVGLRVYDNVAALVRGGVPGETRA